MKRFWIWYDNKCQEPWRFLLFFGSFIFLVTIPGIIGHITNGELTAAKWQIPGICVMVVLAISKITRWSDWPKGKE